MSHAAKIEYEKYGPISEKEAELAKLPIVTRDDENHVLFEDGSTLPLKEAYK